MTRNKINLIICCVLSFTGVGPLALAFAEAQYESQSHWSCLRIKEPDILGLFKTQWLKISGYPMSTNLIAKMRTETPPVLRSFISDGCSLAPDRFPVILESEDWIDCCVAHDIEYWLGGTQAEKQIADVELKTCISKKGSPQVAKIYEQAVQKFGGWENSTTFRWGYGWNFKRPYSPLLIDEIKMAAYFTPEVTSLSRESIKKSLMKNTRLIYEVCDVIDRGLNDLEQDEIDILKALSLNMQPTQNQKVIEWGKIKTQTNDKKIFEIKFIGCRQPVLVAKDLKTHHFKIEKNDCGI